MSDPLLTDLCERIAAWCHSIGLQLPPALEANLRTAFTEAASAGVDLPLWVLIVGSCEHWFRICTVKKREVECALKDRLAIPDYFPYWDAVHFRTRYCDQPPSIAESYVVNCLLELWGPDTAEDAEEIACSLRAALRTSVKRRTREWAGPILVVDNRRLDKKRGKPPQWGPWVAAAALYEDAATRFPQKKNSKPLKVARTLLKALLGREPDKRTFHRRRKTITRLAPALLRNMVSDQRKRLKAYQPLAAYKRVQYLVQSDTFDSLEEWGGMQLIFGRSQPTESVEALGTKRSSQKV